MHSQYGSESRGREAMGLKVFTDPDHVIEARALLVRVTNDRLRSTGASAEQVATVKRLFQR